MFGTAIFWTVCLFSFHYLGRVPIDLESQGKSVNFVDGPEKLMCIAQVVFLLFIEKKMKIVHVLTKW